MWARRIRRRITDSNDNAKELEEDDAAVEIAGTLGTSVIFTALFIAEEDGHNERHRKLLDTILFKAMKLVLLSLKNVIEFKIRYWRKLLQVVMNSFRLRKIRWRLITKLR